jgi:predicted secreted hydrolase
MLGSMAAALVQPALFARESGSGQHASPPAVRSTPYAPVVPGYRIRFPQDEGSHPEFRIEWWYVTGWLGSPEKHPRGFQITFFRARPELKEENPSAFTPRHILIAHAALSDPAHGRLVHAQRAARAGFELAGAEVGRMRVWIDDWSLVQEGPRCHARLRSPEFGFEFTFTRTQEPLLQGIDGYSRKGPAPESASYYYSLPHLELSGTLVRRGRGESVKGSAWLDHEWSSSYLPEQAVGWDWVGINLADGGALMAFRMRGKDGGPFWAGGTLRRADGRTRIFSPQEVRFIPGREWTSPRTATRYPVSWELRVGEFRFGIEPLMDDQEQDARASAGTIYWEGAVTAISAGTVAGRGYLELTGYWRPQRL